jgi:steroid delta-isomerase-like uncharacterized protein
MSIEENKALARRWLDEVWNKVNLAEVDELCTTDFTFSYAAPGVSNDREGYKQTVIMLTSGVSDLKITLEDIVAEGDKVVIRWKGSSKHTGDFMGMPATGKQLSMTGISIVRIEGSKIAEEWGEMDMMGLMQQIGAFPPPE